MTPNQDTEREKDRLASFSVAKELEIWGDNLSMRGNPLRLGLLPLQSDKKTVSLQSAA